MEFRNFTSPRGGGGGRRETVSRMVWEGMKGKHIYRSCVFRAMERGEGEGARRESGEGETRLLRADRSSSTTASSTCANPLSRYCLLVSSKPRRYHRFPSSRFTSDLHADDRVRITVISSPDTIIQDVMLVILTRRGKVCIHIT